MKFVMKMVALAGLASTFVPCNGEVVSENKDFKYLVDEFADLKVMRYQVPGWDSLSLQQKRLKITLNQLIDKIRAIHGD